MDDIQKYIDELEAKLKHQDERVIQKDKDILVATQIMEQQRKDKESLEARVKELEALIENNKQNLIQTNVGWTKTVQNLEAQLAEKDKEVEKWRVAFTRADENLPSPATLGVSLEDIESVLAEYFKGVASGSWPHLAKVLYTALLKKVEES